ncbi:9803_t:CDS:2 [Paraglomus occultum]|uniref:9803_t:CDS:1 n=1 Tax=Paraglomus occultum TaxID=144539 RepID=A0A9N8VR15_9GLOM|nr:9803_t:CDS:2 [Paraglomus occultum]
MPFRLGRRRNDSGSTGSFSTATPPETPGEKDLKDLTAEPEEIERGNSKLDDTKHEGREETEEVAPEEKAEGSKSKREDTIESPEDDPEQVIATTATASSASFSDLPATPKPDWADDIPPDTTDDSSQIKTRRKLMLRDEEPVLYRDKYMAVSKTYLYIFHYYMPSGSEKAIPLTQIKNIQTDKEAKITDGQFQKWGSGGLNLWWARDFGRWRNHDLCVIVTVNHGLVKRKGFTMEDLEGLDILKKAWRNAIGARESEA